MSIVVANDRESLEPEKQLRSQSELPSERMRHPIPKRTNAPSPMSADETQGSGVGLLCEREAPKLFSPSYSSFRITLTTQVKCPVAIMEMCSVTTDEGRTPKLQSHHVHGLGFRIFVQFASHLAPPWPSW